MPAGGQIRSTDADMVQLVGEISDQAWIDLRTARNHLVKIKGPENETFFEPRLTLLAERGVWRRVL